MEMLRGASGFALFKLAVIVQQIYNWYVQGHTRDPFRRVHPLGSRAQARNARWREAGSTA